MTASIKHEGNDSYLVIDGPIHGERENFILRMITENRIEGLLLAGKHDLNGEQQIYYRINGMVSLKERYEKCQMKKEQLAGLLLSMEEVQRQLESYLLDGDNLLLSPDHIYASTVHETFSFCLYPGSGQDIRSQIRLLAEYLLEHINHEDEEVVAMAYRFYRMTRDENFEFFQIVEELVKNGERTAGGETWDVQPKGQQEDGIVPSDTLKERESKNENMSWDAQPGGERRNSGIPWDKLQEREKKNDDMRPESARTHAGLWGRKPQKNDTRSIAAGRLFWCLAMGSLLVCIYTCMLKSYYYGYSALGLFTVREVQISLALLIVSAALAVAATIRGGGSAGREDNPNVHF